ncbi:MAG: DUF2284 domain-containing protein [Monoglobales bacterium]
MLKENNMVELYKTFGTIGFDNVKEISTELLPFQPSLIELCKQNSCGNYGKNYTCPPHIGEIDELIKKAKRFNTALVFQKVYRIEDSFDFEGMTEANDTFRKSVQRVNDFCKENLSEFLLLGAGGCKLCPTCGMETDEPCRFPDDALASLESYGIFVSELASVCGMNYINGVNTVTYFGALLYDKSTPVT